MQITLHLDTDKLITRLKTWGITVEGYDEKPKQVRGKKAGKVDAYTPHFEKFWKRYPRREDKKIAFESWCTIVERGVDWVNVIKGADAYAEYCKTEGYEHKHIKMASTWINNDCWTNTYKTVTDLPKKVDKAKLAFDAIVLEIVKGHRNATDKGGYWSTIYDKYQDAQLFNGFDVVQVAKQQIKEVR